MPMACVSLIEIDGSCSVKFRTIALVLVGVLALVFCGLAAHAAARAKTQSGFIDIKVIDGEVVADDKEKLMEGVKIYIDDAPDPIGTSPITGYKIAIDDGKKEKDIRIRAEKINYGSVTRVVSVKVNEIIKVSFKFVPAGQQVTRVTTFVVEPEYGAILVVIDGALGESTTVAVDDRPITLDGKNPTTGSLKISKMVIGGNKKLTIINKERDINRDLEFALNKGETLIFSARPDGIRLEQTIPPKSSQP